MSDEQVPECRGTSRRTVLKTGSLLAGAVALAGCEGLRRQRFEAAPATLGAPASGRYEPRERRTLTERREESVGGTAVEVVIENRMGTYERAAGSGWVGTLTSPDASMLGQSLNPLAGLTPTALVGEYGDPMLTATALTGRKRVGWRLKPAAVGEFSGTLLGSEVPVTTLLGVTESQEAVLLRLGRTTNAGDLVVVASVQQYPAPEAVPDSAAGLLGEGGVPSEGQLAEQREQFRSVLDSVEHPAAGDPDEPTTAPTESDTDDPQAILTDVRREPMGGGRDRITATYSRYESGVGFVDQRVRLDDLGYRQAVAERTPDRSVDVGTYVTPPPRPSETPGDDSERLAGRIAGLLSVLTMTLGTSGSATAAGSPLPDTVSLKSEQTPLRHQGGRGTCVRFGVVAALEAAYSRAGYGKLDLSEQYANHLEKMVLLHDEPGKRRNRSWSSVRDTTDGTLTGEGTENHVGTGGGGWIGATLAVLKRYGIPKESDAQFQPSSAGNPSYVGDGDYENASQRGDDPGYTWKNPTATKQVDTNAFNLADEMETWQISPSRTNFQLKPFPREALWNARYGVESYLNIGEKHPQSWLLQVPVWFESTLASGREVIISLATGKTQSAKPKPEEGDYADEDTFDDAVEQWKETDGDTWVHDPSGAGGGHCIVLVGYDRTADVPHFVAKNSWQSYEKLGYDLFANGVIDGAAIIGQVKQPDSSRLHEQDVLGRWDVVYDGGEGTLDVFRLSGFYEPEDLPPRNSTPAEDRRIGSFTDANGDLYRVNGRVVWDESTPSSDHPAQGELRFNVDFDDPNQAYDSLSGTEFLGHIHLADRTLMAGTVRYDDKRGVGGFTARKEGPTGTPRTSGTSMQSLLGEWVVQSPFHTDGARFVVTDYDTSDSTFTGRLADEYRSKHSYAKPVTASKRRYSEEVTIGFGSDQLRDDGTVGTFDGRIHADTRAYITGTYDTGGETAPMVLVREGPIEPLVDITSHTDGQTTVQTKSAKGVTLEAFVVGEPGSTVQWTAKEAFDEDASEFILGTGDRITAALGEGKHEITATYTGQNPPSGPVTDTVVLNVDTEAEPTIRLISPADDAYLTTVDGSRNYPYTEVTLEGLARGSDGTMIPGSDIEWAYRQQGAGKGWQQTGTGTKTTVELADVKGPATWYDIRMTATDSAGNSVTETVTVRVQLWGT